MVASDNVKLESSSDGRVHWLIIDKVGVDDEGEYTVRATTDVAQTSSTANVLIQRAFIILFVADTIITRFILSFCRVRPIDLGQKDHINVTCA